MVSIVVPVYNVENYLKRCVDSIRAQTEKQLEIILVDDGSTDSSGRMCDEFAKQDSRIRVLHKKNGGLTSAWIAGVREALGEYIGFVDSDDWIDSDMYEVMYKKAVEFEADMVLCGLVKEFENPACQNRNLTDELSKEFYGEKEIKEEIYPVFLNNGSFDSRAIPASRAMKLYRKSLLLENIAYCNDEVSIGEDLVITLAVFLDCKKIYAVHDFYPYHYWINEKSMTGRHDPDYLNRLLTLKKQLDEINLKKQVYDFSKQILNDFLFLVMMCLKEEIHKNKTDSVLGVIQNVRHICENKEVQSALRGYHMPKLMLSGRLFVWLMKHRLYALCYLAVKIAFR